MGDNNYAYEKMCDAVDVLAIGGGKITKRLESAYISFSPVTEKDFPDELKADYKWIMEKLTKKDPMFDEGSVRATLYGMHTKTAVKIAEKILDLRNRLELFV
ncbi:MAG: hypothetical protein H8E98_04260 [Bacteroidetes bacterium]|nr:hypothetical protein [Bacteroidota bacterium]